MTAHRSTANEALDALDATAQLLARIDAATRRILSERFTASPDHPRRDTTHDHDGT